MKRQWGARWQYCVAWRNGVEYKYSMNTVGPYERNMKTVRPWFSGYHYCTTSFNKAWTQVMYRLKLKFCSLSVGDSRWWGSLTMIPGGNKVNHFRLSTITQKQFIIIIIIIIMKTLHKVKKWNAIKIQHAIGLSDCGINYDMSWKGNTVLFTVTHLCFAKAKFKVNEIYENTVRC